MALVYVALVWAAGLFVADRLVPILPLTWLLIAVGGVGAWFFTRDLPRWRIGFILLAAFGFAASRMAAQPRSSELAAYNGIGGATVEGVIIDPPNARDTSVQARIAVETLATTGFDTPVTGLVLAQLPAGSDARYGDRVRVTGRLRAPEEGDSFDYATYLARRGVFSLLDRVSGVQTISRNHGSPLIAAAVDLRDGVRATVSRYLPEPHAGILTAVLTGDERGISPAVEDAYSASGIAHLLAVSGFNMALVGGLALRVIERVERRKWLWLALGLALLTGYTALVGFSASASRAAVMAALILTGSTLNRQAYLPASLGFALIVLTLTDPGAIFDLGFQLSFGAVLGIALIASPITRQFPDYFKPAQPRPLPQAAVALLADSLVVTVAASALTMPLIGLTFGKLSLISFLTNALVVPVQPVVMILGVVILLVAFVPLLAQAVAYFCLVPLAWTTTVARALADVPVEIAVSLNQVVVAGVFGAAITTSVANATRPRWWEWLRGRPARAAAYFGIVCAAVLAFGVIVSRPDDRLHVWILDVGHSHAVLIQTPSGAQILVDGGRYPSRLLTDLGDRLPFNDSQLDAVIVTQPDAFDIAALPAVIRRYGVGQVYSNGQSNFGAEMTDIAALSALTPLVSGQILDAGDGVTLEALHPQTAPDVDDALDDVSLVLRVRYGGVSFLLTGDISRAAQAELLASGEPLLASVLVLPQHGASLNDGLLDAVQPSAVVLQSDRANLLGDPSPDVLAKLPEMPFYRTDQHGALHFFTDGTDLYIETEH